MRQLRTVCFDLDCATIEKKEAAESAGRKNDGEKTEIVIYWKQPYLLQ